MVAAGGLSAVKAGAVEAGLAVTVKDPDDAFPAEFVAVTVKVPDPLGVPDNTPVALLSVNPAGKEPALTAKVGAGVPEATKVYE